MEFFKNINGPQYFDFTKQDISDSEEDYFDTKLETPPAIYNASRTKYRNAARESMKTKLQLPSNKQPVFVFTASTTTNIATQKNRPVIKNLVSKLAQKQKPAVVVPKPPARKAPSPKNVELIKRARNGVSYKRTMLPCANPRPAKKANTRPTTPLCLKRNKVSRKVVLSSEDRELELIAHLQNHTNKLLKANRENFKKKFTHRQNGMLRNKCSESSSVVSHFSDTSTNAGIPFRRQKKLPQSNGATNLALPGPSKHL